MTNKTARGPLSIHWIDPLEEHPFSERLLEYHIAAHRERLASGEVWINGTIDRSAIETTTMRLLTLAYSEKFARLNVFINSGGGDVDAGFGLIDTMMNLPIPVWTINVGEAASMGLSIFLAGERRFAFPHSNFMAHSISYDKGQDKLDEQESYLEFCKLKQRQHAEYYSQRTKKTTKWWLAKYREADYWFDAHEAMKLGIVTDIADTAVIFNEIIEGVKGSVV